MNPNTNLPITMSAARAQDDIEAQQNDASVRDAPDGLASDNDYTSRVGQKQAPIPVQSDADAVADNNPDVDDPDSDQALGTRPFTKFSLSD